MSEDVAHRLIAELGTGFEVGLKFKKNGFGYLKAKLGSFCELAKRQPLLLITDLDRAECPASLISRWTGDKSLPNKLVFRVAVREIESWLLADHDGMRKLLKKGAAKLPDDADALADPKRFLLRCAERAPRDVRFDLLAQSGAIASQGLGYNQRMGDFVRNEWNPQRAAACSNSLSRAILRLKEIA